eukprot:TRINITY_DN27902_c0_g1_i2.p1 TRINITY_DN27902_c0_g1~~TRINITY_DN27902_c0_g1_i2.p1  ORF type:complete len:208 (-),score=51.96 TRINITY_DN27902_c0_g1_i2:66-689(-)
MFTVIFIYQIRDVLRTDVIFFVFFFQAEDGIRDAQESRGLGDVYKRQVLILISGALCWVLEKDWITSVGAPAKTPMYGVLGASLAFSICFTLGDIINQGVAYCRCFARSEELISPVVNTQAQVYVLVVAGIGGGAIVGVMFGLEDNEDGPSINAIVSHFFTCLLYTSDAADEEDSVDLGGRRIIKKKKKTKQVVMNSMNLISLSKNV